MIYRPETYQRVIDRIPDNADGCNNAGMCDADAHDIGQEEQVKQILKVKDHIAGSGERGKAEFFQCTNLWGQTG